MLILGQLQRLMRKMSKAPKNQRQVSLQWLYLSQWTYLLEATKHPDDYLIAAKSIPAKKNYD